MPTPDEIARIAAAMNAARPDWPVNSLRTFLGNNHGSRAYRDLLVAGVIVASDPKTETPKLLNQNGPWWVAAQKATGGYTDLHFEHCPDHHGSPAANCSGCRADDLGETTQHEPEVDEARVITNKTGAALVREALRKARGDD